MTTYGRDAAGFGHYLSHSFESDAPSKTVEKEVEIHDLEIDVDDLMAEEETGNPAFFTLAEKMGSDSKSSVVGITVPNELDRFVEGFSGLTEHYQALEAVVSDIKAQTREMGSYSQSLKNEAAKNSAIAAQAEEYRADNAELRRIAEIQYSSLEELEAELVQKSTTLSKLIADLRRVTTESEELKARFESAKAENSTLAMVNEQLKAQLLERKSAYERAMSEVQNLRANKSEIVADLRRAHQEVSDVKCKLAELEAEYEKLSAYQESLVTDHGKLSEERRQLRRKIAAVEGELSEQQVNAQRLNDTNAELVGRLKTEKFSMNKAFEALSSEYTVAKQRLETQAAELETVTIKLETEQEERLSSRETLRKNSKSLEESRRELSRANLAISELNLKHSSDRLTLDQLRDENVELRSRMEKLQRENIEFKASSSEFASKPFEEPTALSDEFGLEKDAELEATVSKAQTNPLMTFATGHDQSSEFSTAFNFKSSNYDD